MSQNESTNLFASFIVFFFYLIWWFLSTIIGQYLWNNYLVVVIPSIQPITLFQFLCLCFLRRLI